MGPATFMAVAHQPGLFQDPEMLRDGGLRNSGPIRQGADRLLSVAAQTLENSPPRRVGERSEEAILMIRHVRSITPWLLIDV
jgi:hypothetical protein